MYEYEDIRKQGATAAVGGAWLLDCPYFRRDLLPSRTHEPLTQWLQKVRAWETGWRDEQRTRARM